MLVKNTQNTRMIFLISVLVILSCPWQRTESEWLINTEQYHISVHSTNSCEDCHMDIHDRNRHPDPPDVNKTLEDFFSATTCTACHDEVIAKLKVGIHGDKAIDPSGNYDVCIVCHDPHYQQSMSAPVKGYDPAIPVDRQCGVCHEPRKRLPEPSANDMTCLGCHEKHDMDDPKTVRQISAFCFFCHSDEAPAKIRETGIKFPLINTAVYASTPHAALPCLSCHLKADEFKHMDQTLAQCNQCHLPHDEKKAHDLHTGVSCKACHLQGGKPIRDTISKEVLRQKPATEENVTKAHRMVPIDKKNFCRRCHYRGNDAGAAAIVLPPKSFLCMPCHASTFSVDDGITIVSLVLFLLGIISMASVWFSGRSGHGNKKQGSKGVSLVRRLSRIATFLPDILLQRRLYRQSSLRWCIHSLIFFPFVFRFIWGLTALVFSLWFPEKATAWTMLDKNHPVTAFLFDFSGILMLFGIVLTIIRKIQTQRNALPGLPRQDFIGVGLIAGILIIGFILEGIRIAMTQTPPGAEYAFLGYGISLMLSNVSDPTFIFSIVWYGHAFLTGALLVYLPFSNMFHILTSPVTLIMNTGRNK